MWSRRSMMFTAAIAAGSAMWPGHAGAKPVLGDDGLYEQGWLLDSFLVMAEDAAAAAQQEKTFAVLIEQRGCPYCREMHNVNFEVPEIRDYIVANYDIVQLDMWGSRIVTDFDGEQMEERDLAARWRVNFTPTMIFFPPGAANGNKPGHELESTRMPGYFKPFHFMSMLEYAHTGSFAKQPFQRFLQDKFKRLEAEGKKPQVW